MTSVAYTNEYGVNDFNPHPHAEGDLKVLTHCINKIISIHTLTQRVTYLDTHSHNIEQISIHTLTQRVT